MSVVRAMRWGVAGIVVVLGAAVLFFLVAGEALVWSSLRPDDAALLEGAELPSVLEPGAVAADVDWLLGELPRRTPRFHTGVDSVALRAEGVAVRDGLVESTRDARALSLMRLVNLPSADWLGTGHTHVPALQHPLGWDLYPFVTYLFDDGLWVVLGDGPAEDAVGWEIVEVGGRATAEVIEAAGPYVAADNESGRKDELVALLSHAGFLRGLGLTSSDGTVSLGLRDRAGTRRDVAISPVPLASLAGFRWGRRVQEAVDHWSPADPRPRLRPYTVDFRPADRLLHVRIDLVRDSEEETLAELGARVAALAERDSVDRVVLDLRSNGGGNNQLVEAFVDQMAGHPVIDRPGVLYTVIGRRTFSAAGGLATALERRTRTLFVGEPSGFTPNHTGDAVTVRLPATDVLVRLSTRYWQDGGPFDRRHALEPQIPVRLESHHHFDGEDPALAAVLDHRLSAPPAAELDAGVADSLARTLPGRYRFGPVMALEIPTADTTDPGTAGAAGSWPAGFTIRGTGTWAESGLRPLDSRATRLETDNPGVLLLRDPRTGDLAVDWRGATHPLPRMGPDERLPIERIRAGVDEPRALDAGIAAYRGLAAAGAVLDSRTEFALNRVGYDLLRAGRPAAAVRVFRLQADLFPTVPNAFDSLGEAYLAAGDTTGAIAALEQAIALDPGFDHPRSLLRGLGGH